MLKFFRIRLVEVAADSSESLLSSAIYRFYKLIVKNKSKIRKLNKWHTNHSSGMFVN
jgi:hypothetical protein